MLHLAHIHPVTTLESVVIQLQDSCRDSRKEATELRDENIRLRHEYNERERMWRAFAHARKTGQAADADDLPPPTLSSPFMGDVQSNALSPSLMQHHPFPTSGPYRGDSIVSQCAFPSSSAGSSFSGASSTVPFTSPEIPTDASIPHRAGRYGPYPYQMQGSRDQRWNGLPANMSSGGSIASPHSQSPGYVESPSLTSGDMSTYPTRFSGGDEQKAALNSVLENAPYVFPNGDRFHQPVGGSIPNSRSISPTTTSTPSSSTSMSLTSSFPYTFAESATTHEHPDFDYRRHSLPHCPEVTLHGGTADISLTGQAPDTLRYRMGTSRRPDSGADQHNMSPSENDAHQDQGSSDGDQSYNGSRAESRRHTISNHSGSPSPGPAPISCTVAVIKAQAFGALRRTRAKTKKTSEGAARVTKGVLEARGIGIDGPAKTKRPRLDDEYGNTETP